ncbi:uncharacterized protein A4U43_C10F17730 [Asparagus officinalis]|uniref:Uncharacterized protein n=1 Tax=Asparagus officinalis TaxID=4686 RepID=A0A5P1E3T5_ASPOF|nr:uncharacterized protein LOC109826138 [Asparagus officinalis]ONK57210.1 uncharacterized protein A4U43_C10F17730 [Asparagus officinalis]
MEGMELKGSLHRIRECAFEFFSMEDDLDVGGDDDDGEDGDYWEMLGRDFSLKSTFLYCDLNRIIKSSCDGDHKDALVGLTNGLFFCMEELGHAVKRRSISLTQFHYNQAKLLLEEVMAALVHPSLN